MSGEQLLAFVRLVDEGTEVFRPVGVEMLDSESVRIVSPQTDDETWEFSPGDVVRLVDHTTSSGQIIKLVAAGGQGQSA